MVGANHVLAFCLLVSLPCWDYLFDRRHGGHGLLGIVMGSAAFVAVLSGYLLWLTALDILERKKHPNRKGLGAWAAAVLAVFAASVLACVVLYRGIADG